MTLGRKTDNGPEQVDIAAFTAGRTVVIFAVPGAFTPTCSSAHLPGFIRTAEDFAAKGVDEIACVSVNDLHVMKVWGDQTGATEAGITMLADPDAAYARALGLTFSNEPFGMHDRSRRYAMLVEDGVVTKLMLDEIGVCDLSTAEALLAELG